MCYGFDYRLDCNKKNLKKYHNLKLTGLNGVIIQHLWDKALDYHQRDPCPVWSRGDWFVEQGSVTDTQVGKRFLWEGLSNSIRMQMILDR